MLGPVVAQALLHHPHQLGQEQEVVLEEGMLRNLPAGGFHAEHGLDPTLRRRIAPPLRDGLVQRRFGDGARFDVAHQAAVGAHETQVQFLGGLVPLATDQDPIAVMIGVRARNHPLHDGRIKTTDTPEQFADLPMLPAELGRVVEVLVLATATLTEVGAFRRHALRGTRDDLHQFSPTETLLHLGELGLDDIARRRKWDEHHEFTHTSHPFSAESEVRDFQAQPLAGDGQSVGQCFHPAELPRIGSPTKGRT